MAIYAESVSAVYNAIVMSQFWHIWCASAHGGGAAGVLWGYPAWLKFQTYRLRRTARVCARFELLCYSQLRRPMSSVG